jgi:cytochrome b pre-mRNA-processing protein 3
MLGFSGASARSKRIAERLYPALIQRGREPVFFTKLGVPDSIDGRFDVLALHAWLLLERLREEKLDAIAQRLIDAVFTGFDEGLRDLGAGDMAMGRRIKKLADAFYGRLHAYENSGSASELTEALLRNLYRGDAASRQRALIVARYVDSARRHLAHSAVAQGAIDFGPLPEAQMS